MSAEGMTSTVPFTRWLEQIAAEYERLRKFAAQSKTLDRIEARGLAARHYKRKEGLPPTGNYPEFPEWAIDAIVDASCGANRAVPPPLPRHTCLGVLPVSETTIIDRLNMHAADQERAIVTLQQRLNDATEDARLHGGARELAAAYMNWRAEKNILSPARDVARKRLKRARREYDHG